MNKRVLESILFLILSLNCYSQKMETWLMGVQFGDYDPNNTIFHDTATFNHNHNEQRGATIMNFKPNTISYTRYKNSLSTFSNNLTMCDSNGNLFFYSNGSRVFNYKHQLIQNADSLNYNRDWEVNPSSFYFGQFNIAFHQSILTIQNPYNINQYYLFANYYDWGLISTEKKGFTKIMYSIIDMSLNGGLGKLIVKEKLLEIGNYTQSVFGTKKANGKDWWILVRNMDSTNCFTKISVDSSGVKLEPNKECIGYNLFSKEVTSYFNGGNFSHDGRHFAYMSYRGLELFDFNRCTGKLSNHRAHEYPINDTAYDQFIETAISFPIFSPNNNYVYYVYSNRIYQYEVNSPNFINSQVRVATYDGTVDRVEPDTMFVGWYADFCTPALATNGKIYMGTWEDTRYLHTIDSPDKKGLACKVNQHSVYVPTFKRGLPYYPNYNLGAEKCCGYSMNRTLTINLDTTIKANDTGQYQWLYCDSNYKPILNATSQVFKPKKSGNYAVRISNIYCLDTSECIYVKVKDSVRLSIHDFLSKIEVYPNPAKDIIQFNSENKDLKLDIYNMMGQKLLSSNLYVNIDIRKIENGLYLCQIIDKNGTVLKSQKLVVDR